MNQHDETTTAIKPFAAIEPRKKFALFQRREDYPIVPTPSGDHVVLPIKDYRKFRGETSYWQFLFLLLMLAFIGMSWMAYTQPPIYVDKPFVVEKEKPVVVPSRCILFCK